MAMIRVQLQRQRRQRRLVRAAITPLLAAYLCLALVHWIDSRVGLMNLLQGRSLAEWTGLTTDVPSSMSEDMVEDVDPAREVSAPQVVVEDPPPPVVLASLPVPTRSDACHRALELYGRLPLRLMFTSLSGRVIDGGEGGEYTLEGLSEPEEVATLFSFLDTLKSLPSEVNLSYWREGGKTGGSYRFTFHGTLGEPVTAGVPAVAIDGDGSALLSHVSAMAARAGLDSLMTKGPISTQLSNGHGRLRQKHWAVGSYAQIQKFAQELEEMPGNQPVLAELVIMPGHGGPKSQYLQLYAALDVVVAGEGR
jgi:hypothetical protein